MRHVVSSIFNAVRSFGSVTVDAKRSAMFELSEAPMVALCATHLRHIVGGTDDLPKGGWKNVAPSSL
jgi:hypothetical protein